MSSGLLRLVATLLLVTHTAVLAFSPTHKAFRSRRTLFSKTDDKWAGDVDDFKERIESGKAAVVGGLVGSISFAPADFLQHPGNIAQWEWNTDQMALQGALFAIVYRYATREDGNPQLKQGVVGAFSLVRTLSMVQVSPSCEAIPLRCGAPLSYVDWTMLKQLAGGGFESAVAFVAVAAAFEYLANKGKLGRFPSSSPPPQPQQSKGD